jgi:hypothetical protein
MRDLVKQWAGRAFPTEFYERFVAHAALQHQYAHVLRSGRAPTRWALWEQCIRTLGPEQPVLMLEFGVWKGDSLRYFSERMRHPDARFYGFDSFEGLPEDWGGFAKGSFATAGDAPVSADPRVTFVKGWFQNTFDAAVAAAKQGAGGRDTVLVHFDADLYSSTLFLLCKLSAEFDRYYFVFDEFTGHETRALLNFQQAFGAEAEFLGYSGAGLPEQVFGRLDNRRGAYRPR